MKRIKSNAGGQLRWVILLLAIAVILPTVCLLWFMTQAVRNERLAVRQKLIDVYNEKAQQLFVELPDSYSSRFYLNPPEEWSKTQNGFSLYAMFELFAAVPNGHYEGMLIYDSSGALVYPIVDSNINQWPEELIEPFQQELKGNLRKAIEQYEKAAEQTQSETTRYKARLWEARCLDKLDRKKEAVALAYKLSYPANPEGMDSEMAVVVIHSRVFLAGLYEKADDENFYYHLRRILRNGRYNNEPDDPYLPSAPAETIIWQLNKMIDIAQEAGLAEKLDREIEYAKKRINAHFNSIEAAEIYPDTEGLNKLPSRAVRRIEPRSDLY